VLIALGVVILLDNFLLLGDFNVAGLLPLVLVVAGAQILLRGDLLPASGGRTFGITRGSVESGTLEISAGDIDVDIRSLQREGRLIAGQFAPESRPRLTVDGTQTTLQFYRADTPWYALIDWQIALARDLPWGIYASTHLGQLNFDLGELIVQDALIATGMGDIRVVVPREALGEVRVRSALGSIQIVTPKGHAARIHAAPGWVFTVRADETRYVQTDTGGIYESLDADEDAPLVEVYVEGAFGDAYLM
jgi:hypothetical protein